MNLFLALILIAAPFYEKHDPPPAPMHPKIRWAWIVTGESSGGWPEGDRLVAWTLRAWEVHRGMPPGLAGPRWGWYGWKEPTAESYTAVTEAWEQPVTSAPFDFMQSGHWCRYLGSSQDRRFWIFQLGFPEPDFSITFERQPEFSLHCWFAP